MRGVTGDVASRKRLDIQALRALAVVSVLLFHIDLPGVWGGYLGVDIFFVVSGFLITRILDREVLSGDMSLAQFYGRRIRRLLPAAVVAIAVTLAVAAVLFVSVDLAPAAKSAAAALISSSNILFWLQSGYFDTSSELKPLLHTWSLGVEEQFYLVWPALMLVSARYGRRALIAALAVLGLISLVLAQAMLPTAPEAVFYLMPFRAFEFAIGGLLSFVRPLSPGRMATIVFAIGWAMMIVSVVWLGANYPMPGFLSLMPAGGAGLAILAGAGAPRWLIARPVVATGDLSYSLYLVHWPLVTFYKYKLGSPLDPMAQILLVGGSFILAWLLYRFVEQPMRKPEFWRGAIPAFRAVAGIVVVLATFGAAAGVWASDGVVLKQRVRVDPEAFRRSRKQFLADNLLGRTFRDAGRRVIIIGDSHAQDVFDALYQAGSTNLRFLVVDYACQPVLGPRPIEGGPADLNVTNAEQARGCAESVSGIINGHDIMTADTIVIAARWKEWAVPRVADTIAALHARTHEPIVVFGPTMEYEKYVPRIIQEHGSWTGIDKAAQIYEDRRRRDLNEDLKKRVEAAGAIFVDKFSLLCNRDQVCPVVVPGTTTPFIFDYGHWTLEGAAYFGGVLRNASPSLREVLFGPPRITTSSLDLSHSASELESARPPR